MPEAIGLIVLEGIAEAAGIGAFGGTITIFGLSAAASATLVGSTLTIGALIGAQYLMAPGEETRQPTSQPIQKTEVTIRQPLIARFVDIGRVKTGGALFFQDVTTLDRLTLVVGKILSCCRIDGIETIYLNDDIPAFASSPFNQQVGTVISGLKAPDSNNDTIFIETGIGAPTESASPTLLAKYPGRWTTAHDLHMAYAVAEYQQGRTLDLHHETYPSGAPSLSAVVRGAWLPDPRFGQDMHNPETWSYNDNAALAILRFLLDVDGWGHPPEYYDLGSFQGGANYCDEIMPDGHKRYIAWGRYTTANQRKNTLDRLLENCDGRLIEQPDGRAKLFVGRYVEPTFVIENEHILEVSIDAFGDSFDSVGGVKPRIVFEFNNWQETDLEPVVLANADADTAIKIEDFDLPFCPHPDQARRLAQARLLQLNPDFRGTIRTTLHGLQAAGERFIRVRITDLQIDRVFEIVGGVELHIGDGFQVSMQIATVNSAQWD